MNINEFNRIKTIDLSEAMTEETGTGTFKEILDNVYNNKILPLVVGDGTIVGISYNANSSDMIQDCIEQVKFERRYRGKDVMMYVLKALELKAQCKVIEKVIEDGDDISVILDNGETIVIKEDKPYKRVSPCMLPTELGISYNNFDISTAGTKEVKDYLRNAYDHYLAKDNEPEIIWNDDDQVVTVKNIKWGRER